MAAARTVEAICERSNVVNVCAKASLMLCKFSRKENSEMWDLDCTSVFTVSNHIDCALLSACRRIRGFISASHIYLRHLTLTTNIQNNYSCQPPFLISSPAYIQYIVTLNSILVSPLLPTYCKFCCHYCPWSHSDTQCTQWHYSGRGIGPSLRPLPGSTQHKRQTSMVPAGFEPATPAIEGPHTHALDRAAIGDRL